MLEDAMSEAPNLTRRDTLRLLLPVLGLGLASAPSDAVAQTGRNGRTLVAYLSRSGNTRVIAGQLKRAFRADLFEIRTAIPYPEDYEEMVAWAVQQRDAAAPPALAASVTGMAGYETVFLGFPIWAMALPAPVRTLLTTHDLSGKRLVPFITYGSSGPGSALRTVAELAPRARIVEPFVYRADQERDTLNRVSAWLRAVEPAL
jgi:flavodoxin